MTGVGPAVAVAGDTTTSEHISGLAASPSHIVVRHKAFAVAYRSDSAWVHAHDDGDVLLVLDGRLHNGPPDSGDDAGWLAQRYRDHGASVAESLLGDFVIVILDRSRDSLLVCRDPLGVRPWYQATSGRRHAGASDAATLVAIPWVDIELDERTIIQYLIGRMESQGATFHRGVTTLAPGSTWHLRSTKASTRRHHEWRFQPSLDISWDDAIALCRERLDEAIRCRIDGSLPVTCELSGGLDSSSVVGTAVLLGRTDVVAGRLVFDGPRADERAFSSAVAEHWDIELVSARPWVPTVSESIDMARALGRPAPDPHFAMFADLHRTLIAAGRNEALTGVGGDDAFLAAPIPSRAISALQLRQGAVIHAGVTGALRHPGEAWRHVVKPTIRYLLPLRFRNLPGLITEPAAERTGLREHLHRRPARTTGIDAIDRRVDGLVSGRVAGGLEQRALLNDPDDRRESHPFLDPRLIEATYCLDPQWPARDGHDRALEVAAYRDRLPDLVASRRSKAEFSEVAWAQFLDPATLERLVSGPLIERGWVEPAGLAVIIQNAKSGRADAALPLSRCVLADRWLRLREAPSVP